MDRWVFLLLPFVPISGCGPCANAPERILEETADWDAFGALLGPAASDRAPPAIPYGISMNLLAAEPAAYAAEDLLLIRDAVVESVSEPQRAWVVRAGDGSGRMRVTFPDPGLALPADPVGRAVVIQGALAEDLTKGWTITASGVRLSP